MKGTFPKEFLWGASSSAHQVEGDNFRNNWWHWEHSGGTTPSNKACNHYNLFAEDFKLAKDLSHNAHRLGIEWSRLEKEEGSWDEAEWDHYKEVLDELIRLKIEPVVTLNHFTVPQWLAEKGSWLSSDAPHLFSRFALKAMRELGTRVNYWITINEPSILAVLSYFWGQWTPCHKDFGEATLVLKNMLKGHALSYQKMHEHAVVHTGFNAPKIGIAKGVTTFHPCSNKSLLDRASSYFRSKFHNFDFIDSCIKGRILLPGEQSETLAVKKSLDFIGLNYYFRQFIKASKPFIKNPLGDVCSLEHHPESGATTDMGWEIYPEGLYEIVKSFSRYRLPLIITENGIATKKDTVRKLYIKNHLTQLLRAMDEGAPVTGYLHWSLLDNFEWDDAFTKRFGLVEVDYKTQKRTVRNSAKYYKSVIESGKP